MPDALRSTLLFLINTAFSLYLFVLAIRVILAYVGANFFDPVTQFTIKLTDVFIKPLKRFIPNFRGIEIASILIIFLIEIIRFLLVCLLSYGLPNILGLPFLALGDTISLFTQCFMYAILIQVILSWVQPMSPLNQTLYQFTSPIMRPLQKVIPTVSGIDITPIPALIILQIITYIIVNPLMGVGMSIALG